MTLEETYSPVLKLVIKMDTISRKMRRLEPADVAQALADELSDVGTEVVDLKAKDLEGERKVYE